MGDPPKPVSGKAVLAAAKNKADPVSRWAIQIQERRGHWKTAPPMLKNTQSAPLLSVRLSTGVDADVKLTQAADSA